MGGGTDRAHANVSSHVSCMLHAGRKKTTNMNQTFFFFFLACQTCIPYTHTHTNLHSGCSCVMFGWVSRLHYASLFTFLSCFVLFFFFTSVCVTAGTTALAPAPAPTPAPARLPQTLWQPHTEAVCVLFSWAKSNSTVWDPPDLWQVNSVTSFACLFFPGVSIVNAQWFKIQLKSKRGAQHNLQNLLCGSQESWGCFNCSCPFCWSGNCSVLV